MTTTYSLERITGPSVEPVTRAVAKKQLEIASGDTFHDDALDDMIIEAREKVENDTDYACISQTFKLKFRHFPQESDPTIELRVRPIQAVSSFTYYDDSETQQTLGTDIYGVDNTRRLVYLRYEQDWPNYTPLHDGIVITFTAGYGSSGDNVPRLLRRAILLDVARQFKYRTGEPKTPEFDSAYDSTIARLMRSSYP